MIEELGRSKFLIVGEAPGAEEEKTGKPFQGKSGKLLFGVLAKLGYSRESFDITNVLHTRPEGNDIGKASKLEIEAGGERLRELVRDGGYTHILAVGNTSLEALCGLRNISDRRGSVYTFRDTPIVASLHPAAVLRDPKYLRLFAADLHKFTRLIAGENLSPPERVVIVATGVEDRGRLAHELDAAAGNYNGFERVIAVDIEADNRELACVGFGISDRLAYVVPCRSIADREYLRDILGWSFPKVFHNAPYDLAFLKYRAGIECRGEIHDTLAMHQALHPELPRSLRVLTSLYTNQPFYKDMYDDWRKTGDYDTYYWYNGLDCCCTKEIYEVLRQKLIERGLYLVYEMTRKVIPHAVEMSILGVKYDFEEAERLRIKTERERDRWQKILDGRVGYPVNAGSPKQVAKLLYDELKLVGTSRSTSEKTLMATFGLLKDRRAKKVLRALFGVRHATKFLTSYLNGTVSEDGRVRTSFNPAGTETGRWSASKFLITEGCNLQTIPPKWKSCFVADEGTLLWMADYSQIEARFVAAFAGDEEQLEMFARPDADIHKLNASRIFGVPIEEVTDEQRQVAKSCVHALNYGIGPQTLMETVNKKSEVTGFSMTLSQAKRIREIYLTQFPTIVGWQKDIWREVKKSRKLTNPFGRTRIFTGPLVGRDSVHTQKEALAFLPQSTVPDLLNRALLQLRENPPCQGFQVALQIHDALGGWGPVELQSQWTLAILAAMQQSVSIGCRSLVVPVELKVGTSLSNLKRISR